VAKVIHNFGRAENVDRDALGRLVSSISRFLDPVQAITAAAGTEVEILDSRHLGGAWTLDRIWERLGIGAAVRRVAAGRRLDAEAVERVLFAGPPAGVGTGVEAGLHPVGGRTGGHRRVLGVLRRPGIPRDGLPARRAR
jgi:hypothetical protein